MRKSPLFIMFIDLEKAYDKIVRSQLWETLLRDVGLSDSLVERLKLLYVDLKVKIGEDW